MRFPPYRAAISLTNRPKQSGQLVTSIVTPITRKEINAIVNFICSSRGSMLHIDESFKPNRECGINASKRQDIRWHTSKHHTRVTRNFKPQDIPPLNLAVWSYVGPLDSCAKKLVQLRYTGKIWKHQTDFFNRKNAASE